MIKEFKELVKLDISKYLVKKPNFVWDKTQNKFIEKGHFNYLNWAKGLELLYENGAEDVQFKPLKNEKGHSVFYDKELGGIGCPEVRIWLRIDNKENEITYPLIRGSKVLEKIDQLDVEVARQRAFTKGVAIMTGLGLSEWIKCDEKIDDEKTEDMKNNNTHLEVQRENTQKLYIEVSKMFGGSDKLNKALDKTKEELGKLFKSSVIQDLKDLETSLTIASTNARSRSD